MLLLLLLFIFVVWLQFTAFTLENPALTMHKEGSRGQHGDESDVPSEKMLNNESMANYKSAGPITDHPNYLCNLNGQITESFNEYYYFSVVSRAKSLTKDWEKFNK